MSNKPTVIIHRDADGINVLINGDVQVFSVCEFTPSDRVYEHKLRVSQEEIAAILGNDPIGHLGDRPSAEQAARALANPGLKLVQS